MTKFDVMWTFYLLWLRFISFLRLINVGALCFTDNSFYIVLMMI